MKVCCPRNQLFTSNFESSKNDTLDKVFSSGDKLTLYSGGRSVVMRPRGPAGSHIIKRFLRQDPMISNTLDSDSRSVDFFNNKVSVRVHG